MKAAGEVGTNMVWIVDGGQASEVSPVVRTAKAKRAAATMTP